MPEIESYSLLIRGSRTTHQTFTSFDEFEAEVKSNLSPSEIKNGVLRRLTSFPASGFKDGMQEKKYQSISTTAYLKED